MVEHAVRALDFWRIRKPGRKAQKGHCHVSCLWGLVEERWQGQAPWVRSQRSVGPAGEPASSKQH